MNKERYLLERVLCTFTYSALDILRDEIRQLLLQHETGAWIKTNGIEPIEWEDYEYVWTHWKSGKISLDEAWGCFSWDEITHWMPAHIKEPSKPQ
ncbi:MAG: hypothetical protein RIR39_1542 [Pseudomonadota bacterium]|jgi:hypothetical protein